jgi:hypothetical protein
MADEPRPDDHLVEPLFAALSEADAERPLQRARGRRLWNFLLTLAAIAALWFVTVGA